MKVLLLFNFYQHTSGEDVYFLSLANLLRKKSHQVYTYTKNSKAIKNNLRIKLQIACRMFWNKKVERELSEIINKFKPDVAHFHNIYPLITPTAYHVCKKFNIPIVQTIHNYRFMCPRGTLFRNGKICKLCVQKKFVYPSIIYGCYHNSRLASVVFSTSAYFHKLRTIFDHIDKYIFLTKFTRNYYIEHLHLPIEKTTVIPYFADVENFSFKQNPKKDYFLYVGRLVEEKGIIPLLQLFSAIPKIKLVIIGDGPLKTEVSKYKKYKNILIRNHVSREVVFNYMKGALSTIIPSLWYDALPLSLIESLACGSPILIPNFSIFKELIVNDKSGIFFEYNNFEDLKIKILDIYRNKELVNKMSLFATEEYKKKYTPDEHCLSIMKVYNSLVK